jgi:hypothetical protein
MVKFTELAPAGTVVVGGTVATDGLLLERVTTNPPVGAAPEIVTVPVEGAGCFTVAGLSVRLDSIGGFTVRVAPWVPPPASVAEILEVAMAPTGILVTMNVVELLPDGTVTDFTDRVATAVFPLATLTTTPPVGAVLFSLTVAVEVAPPIRLAGASVTEEIAGGLIVKVPLADPFSVAVIVSSVTTGTVLVSAVNVAVVAPAATFTLAGTEPDGEVAESATAIPPAGAAAFSVTVPVAFAAPPSTLAGLTSTDRTDGRTTASLFDNVFVAPETSWDPPGTDGGVTVSCAVTGVPFKVAVIFGVVVVVTAVVVTVKVVEVACAGTVTLAGTIAAALSLASVTTAPPTTAGLLSVTVPVEEFPPATVLGAKDTVDITGMMEVTCTVPVVCVPL